MHGKRVLVVDDDHHARFLLGALLDHAGYTVVPDYRMPFLNGIELLRLIQIHYPHVPVILASGSLPLPDEPFLSDCRPFGWLRKPYDNNLLLELVRSAVERQSVVL